MRASWLHVYAERPDVTLYVGLQSIFIVYRGNILSVSIC